jgi:HEAT repeat protein
MLRSPHSWERAACASELGKKRNRKAVPHLIRLLEDPDVPSSAADALGAIGDPRALAALIAAIPRLGASAAAALARIDPRWRQSPAYREARPRLLACLANPNSTPALRVFEALLEAGEPEILPRLSEAWGDPNASGELLAVAIRAAAKGPVPGASQALVSYVRQGGPYVGDAAKALAKLDGRTAFGPIAECLLKPGWSDWGVIEALESIDPRWPDTPEVSQVVAALLARLRDTDSRVRRDTAETLRRLRYPRLLDALAPLLADPDGSVRSKVADIGRNFGAGWKDLGREAVASLVSIAAKDLNDHAAIVLSRVEDRILPLLDAGSPVRFEAAVILARWLRPPSIQPLIELLRTREHPLWENAAILLGRFEGEEVFSALAETLLRPEPAHRDAVIFSLAAVGGWRARAPLREYLERPDSSRSMAELALSILPPEHGELGAHDRALLRGLADYWHLRRTAEAEGVFAELARRFPSKGTCELIAQDLSGYSSMELGRLARYKDLLVQAGRTISPEELRGIGKVRASFWPEVAEHVATRRSLNLNR